MSDYGEDEVHDAAWDVVEQLEASKHGIGLRRKRDIGCVGFDKSSRVDERLVVISMHLNVW